MRHVDLSLGTFNNVGERTVRCSMAHPEFIEYGRCYRALMPRCNDEKKHSAMLKDVLIVYVDSQCAEIHHQGVAGSIGVL